MIPPRASDPLAPLRHFHAVPDVRYIAAETLPESVRSLLAHDGDMTSRLGRAYGSEIQLQVVQHSITDDVLAREVVLRTASAEAVEYGAIEIFLQNLEPEVKDVVVLQREPFGGILNRFGIGYYSSPSAYFVLPAAELPYCAFSEPGNCFARCNVLRDFDGRELARIVEVLSPSAASLNPQEASRPPFLHTQYDFIHLGATIANCQDAVRETVEGKKVLLLEKSCLTAYSDRNAPLKPNQASQEIFSLLLKARRAGVEVHESTDYSCVTDTEITATARDGSTHHLRGSILRA